MKIIVLLSYFQGKNTYKINNKKIYCKNKYFEILPYYITFAPPLLKP